MHDDSNPYAPPAKYANSTDRADKPVFPRSRWPGWFLLCDAILSVLWFILGALPVPIALLMDKLYMELYWLPFWWSPISVAALGVMLFNRKYGAAIGYLVGAATIICIVGESVRVIDRVLTYPTESPVIVITHVLLGSALRVAWNIAYLNAVRVGVGRAVRQNDVPPKNE